MTVLAIDTSTTRGSVAILSGEKILFAEDFVADRSHSATLFAILARAREGTLPWDQVVIGLGPGSYAGIRIAIAAAMGIELTTGASLAGIPSVAAWDTGAADYIAIGDARRETFYWTRVEKGFCTEGPMLLDSVELKSRLDRETLPVFSSDSLEGFPSVRQAFPSARILAQLALAKRGTVEGEVLEPIYLREPHITTPKAK